MSKINYTNKQVAQDAANPVAPIEIFSANDANQIKDSVNYLYDSKQENLISGINIKEVNGQTLLGKGNVHIEGAGFSGFITPQDLAPKKELNKYYRGEKGIYPNIGIEITGETGDISWNGTAWVVVNVTVPLNTYAKKEDVIDTANKVASDSDVFNHFLGANQNDSSFWNQHKPPTTTISYFQPDEQTPFKLIRPVLKLSSTAGENCFVGRSVKIANTDRIIVGAWINKNVFTNTDSAFFSWYFQGFNTQIPDGSPEFNSVPSLYPFNMYKGYEVSYGICTLRVEEVIGDWVYVTGRNTSDFPTGIVSIVPNFYFEAATTNFIALGYNFTFLINEEEINPFLSYDNAAFFQDSLTDVKTYVNAEIDNSTSSLSAYIEDTRKATLKETALIVSRETIGNYLYRGNTDKNFFDKAQPKMEFAIYPIHEPNIMAGVTKGLYWSITGVGAGESAWFYRQIKVSNTDRIIGGMWVRISDMVATNATDFGFYIQGLTAPNAGNSPTVGAPIMIDKANLLNVGYKTGNSNWESEVIAVESGYVYLQFKNTADMPAGTNFLQVNVFASNIQSGIGAYFFGNFSCIKSNVLNPYINYNNAGLSKLFGMRVTVDGTSIIEGGLIQKALEDLTGCITDYSMSKSGSGYTTNPLLAQPPMIDPSRTNAIKNSKPELIILEGGVNDGRVSAPLGTYTVDEVFPDEVGAVKSYSYPMTSQARYYLYKNEASGISNYSHYYPAVYRRLKVVAADNPSIPILVVTPMQSFYYSEQPDTDSSKDSPNKPNSEGHYQIDYSHGLKAVCEMEGIRCLDMYGESGIGRFTYKTRLGDGIHPSTAEHGAMIAKTWISKIESWV